MSTSPHDTTQRAIGWIHAGAILNPGIKFIAIIPAHHRTPQKLYHFEVPPDIHDAWLENVELGFKDGVKGRWIWDSELDEYTKAGDGT